MDYDCDVLIVGAGPVGLGLAAELTLRGHTARIVEKNARVGLQPRAKTTNVRTMTHLRRWGLAETLRARSPLDADFPRRVVFQTQLFGHELHAFENAFNSHPRRDDRYPEHAEFIPQYITEGVLSDHVQAHPLSSVAFGAELTGFEQDGDGVTATVLSDGESRTIRARYLVGADGARSSVRKALGIRMQGKSDLASFVTLILRIPGLRADPDLRAGLFHWLVDPAAPSIIGPLDRDDVWNWAMAMRPGADTATETLLGYARQSIGREVQIEVLARDEWTVHMLQAERYREARVFLAGDACHLHAPFGGHGMNLGISDAVDLGWKLSARLDGWGTEEMLDSYETERRQAHRLVIESATSNLAVLSEHFGHPDLNTAGPVGDAARAAAGRAVHEQKEAEFHSLGLVLGYRYVDSPLIAAEPGPVPPLRVSDYRPTGYAGSLAPHLWIGEHSLYDLFGRGYTLLRLGDADATAEAELAQGATDAGVPLKIVDPETPELRDLYDAGYALIRPDQHVAWRGDALPGAAQLLALLQPRASIPA